MWFILVVTFKRLDYSFNKGSSNSNDLGMITLVKSFSRVYQYLNTELTSGDYHAFVDMSIVVFFLISIFSDHVAFVKVKLKLSTKKKEKSFLLNNKPCSLVQCSEKAIHLY